MVPLPGEALQYAGAGKGSQVPMFVGTTSQCAVGALLGDAREPPGLGDVGIMPEVLEPRAQLKRVRPTKEMRQKYRTFVGRLEDLLAKDPLCFDTDVVEIPEDFSGDAETRRMLEVKARARLRRQREELLCPGGAARLALRL